MVIAGIVAGGTGSRMNKAYHESVHSKDAARGGFPVSQAGNCPKQFMEIGGKAILLHTIEKFLTSPDIDAVVVGVHPNWKKYLEELLDKFQIGESLVSPELNIQSEASDREHALGDDGNRPDVSSQASESKKILAVAAGSDCTNLSALTFAKREILIVTGGGDRTDTLNRIVEAAAVRWQLSDEDIFVTHDAVRPFVTQEIIHENVFAAREYGICGTAIAATDTILHSSDGEFIEDIPLRSEMYQAQTPQSFQYGIYRDVYHGLTQEELASLTDACGMFYRKGCEVYMVPGDVRNFKITYPQDLQLAKALVRRKH